MENKFEFFKEPRKAYCSNYIEHPTSDTSNEYNVIAIIIYNNITSYVGYYGSSNLLEVFAIAVFINQEPVQTIVEKAKMSFEEAIQIVSKVFAENQDIFYHKTTSPFGALQFAENGIADKDLFKDSLVSPRKNDCEPVENKRRIEDGLMKGDFLISFDRRVIKVLDVIKENNVINERIVVSKKENHNEYWRTTHIPQLIHEQWALDCMGIKI